MVAKLGANFRLLQLSRLRSSDRTLRDTHLGPPESLCAHSRNSSTNDGRPTRTGCGPTSGCPRRWVHVGRTEHPSRCWGRMCARLPSHQCVASHDTLSRHGGPDSFCCPGLSGSASFPASSTYKSANDDNYSVRPGISQKQVANSCENSIDVWSQEDFHNDNFEHTSKTTFGATNYKTEARRYPHGRQECQRSH